MGDARKSLARFHVNPGVHAALVGDGEFVAAEAAQEMDSQHLLALLEELNKALEEQGMVKPDGQSRAGHSE